jgi:hypothetical protein
MITAENLTLLSTMGPTALARVLDSSGYKMCVFKTAKFLGLTNGTQFCYQVTYHDESGQGEDVGKVFVSYNVQEHTITADL